MSDRYVYDGDTYYQDGRPIRLFGADAPEKKPAEPGWAQARDALELGLDAGYAPGEPRGSSYGRDLRALESPTGGPTLEAEMVADGLAQPLSDRLSPGSAETTHLRGAQAALGSKPTGLPATHQWQQLVADARAERLEALSAASASGALRASAGAPTNLFDPTQRGVVSRAWDRGVDNLQGTFYGFANALGEVTGLDTLAEWGEEGMARNILEAMQSPAAVESWEDIDSLTDAGIYALEALVEFAPQLATDVLVGIGTGGSSLVLAGAGKALLRSVGGSLAVGQAGRLAAAGMVRSPFLAGAKGGALASMYMQNAGETQMNFALEGIDAPGQALAIGAGKAALDYAGLDRVLRGAFKGLASDAAPERITELLGNSLKAVGVGATAESLTEATQTLIDELAIKGHKPEHQINTSSIIDAMLKGGIAGGGVAGAGRVVTDATRMVAEGARLPGAGDPVLPTAPEPEADIRAQLANTPAGEGNWYTAENAEQAKALAAELGKPVRELEDGSVAVAPAEVLAQLPEQPTQADLARLNGYAQTKEEAAADPQGVAAVEVRDAEGAVLRNQLVGRSVAEAVAQQQAEKFPGAQVEITTPEAAVQARAETVAAEQAAPTPAKKAKQPAPPPKGTLSADEALIEEARSLGVDISRFQKTGLGRAVMPRLTNALQAKVEGGGKRLDAVPALAPLLDMPVEQLDRRYYDARNVIQGRDQMLGAIRQRAVERFGSLEAFAQAIDQLPVSQADTIRAELGLREQGGYDIGRLMNEVQARRSDPDQAKPLDSLTQPATTEEPPARKAAPDKMRDAVFAKPAIRQLLVNGEGKVATADQIDENIERLGKRDRVRLEETLKRMDIDIGGKNRQAFLDLLRDSVVGETAYGIGSQYVDDEASGESGGARIVVPTQEFNPSILDSDDARFYQLVEKTPLTDKSRNGWPAGMALYLEAMSRIVKAGEPEVASALTESEAARMSHARGLALVLSELTKKDGLVDQDNLLTLMAERLGITDTLVQKAAGSQKATLLPALQAMAKGTDRRLVVPLTQQLVRMVNTTPGGRSWEVWDFEILPTQREDDVMLDELVSLLRDDPAAVVTALVDAMAEVTKGEPLDTVGIIADSEASRGNRPVTANVPSSAAVQGENEVAIDGDLPSGEQEMSDESFFRAVQRASVRYWDVAIVPSPGQVKNLEFRDAKSQTLTRHFKGKNLLGLPSPHYPQMGSVVDAIALAAYAQSGEPVPATPGQAAANLMTNIARLMQGAQYSDSKYVDRPKAIIRTIPDDLVIFVDPATGRGVTFGEGLNHRHAVADARSQTEVAQRELDDAVDKAGELAELLDAFAEDLLERTAAVRKTQPIAEKAVQRWRQMMAGERDGKGHYYRRPTKAEDEALYGAMNAIGKMKVDERTLDQVFSEYLGHLGAIKRLGQEIAEARDYREIDSGETDDETVIARKVDAARDMTAKQRARAVTQASRGGLRTDVLADDPDSVDSPRGETAFLREMHQREIVEYNPYAADPLHALSDEAWMDAEDLAQEQAIAALLAAREQGRLAPAMEGEDNTRARELTAEARADHEQRGLAVAPLFRLASTALGSKPAKPMSTDEVQAVVERFQATYKGHLPLNFRIAATQEEVHGKLPGKPVVKGAYHATGGRRHTGATPSLQPGMAGRVVLVAENLADEADVLETLRHEVLGHFGLNTFTPEVKQAILAAVQQSRSVPGMAAIWRDIDVRYADLDNSFRAEEVFAYIAEQERTGLATLFDRIAALIAQGLRKIGLLQGQVTRAELAVLVRQIGAGIRDGHRRQRTFPKTDLDQFRRGLPSDAMLKARAKQFWSKGVAPAAAPLFSMVHSRIHRLHAGLARALFQPAGAEASVLGRSWEQRNRALKGRLMSQLDRALSDIRKGQRGNKASLAVQAAFEDAYSGNPQTEQGKRLRTLVTQLVAEARNAGLRSIRLPDDFAPVAFDRKVVSFRAAEFHQMLANAGIAPDEARELYSRIVDGPGVIEGAFAPGMPVGTHATTRTLVEKIGQEKLLQGGWLLRRHDAALIHWIDGVSKRAAWEGLFGAEVAGIHNEGGDIVANFDPSAKYKAMLDEVRKTHGEQAVQEIGALVNGALGRHPAGQSMPGWWRSTQDFIVGWTGMTVLAFSGIASLPELVMPLLRANGRVGVGAMLTDYQSAKRFARDMGVVLSDASEQVMWQATGDQYRSPMIQKAQSLFFKLNGNELIVKTSRILATGIAMRYLLAAAADGDSGSLGRLNIDAGTVHAWDQLGRPAWSPDLPAEQQVIAAKVTDAVNQFVNEATLNPSRFQATHWGNNPYLKMIWHLKHFLYTYGDTILLGMWREMHRRWKNLDPKQFSQAVAIATPALLFAALVMPMAAAALEARDWVRRLNGQREANYDGAFDYFSAVFDRAGGLGPVGFLAQLRQQQEWGASIFGSLGPVPGKVDMLFGAGSWETKLRQLTPIWSQNKTLFGALE